MTAHRVYAVKKSTLSTTAYDPVVKLPAVHSTAVAHTLSQQHSWGNH